MTNEKRVEILEKTKIWFKTGVMEKHIVNTRKLTSPSEFNINPFLVTYLATFLTGNASPESIAKALVYPRVLGTSITTSFGTHMQKFTSEVLSSYASTTSGIDIEFIDVIDKRRKYCQLKAGPNTINKDDVKTIVDHFKSVKNLARTNNLNISLNDLIVGVIYGDESQLSSHYKSITSQHDHPVFVGSDFWYRLTGDKNLYFDLIKAVGEVISESDFSEGLQDTINKLASHPQIIKISQSVL